jgi:hypothetical protein
MKSQPFFFVINGCIVQLMNSLPFTGPPFTHGGLLEMCMLLWIWGVSRRLVERAVLDGRPQLGLVLQEQQEQPGNVAVAAEADLHPAVLESGVVMAEAARVILAVLAEVDLTVQSVVTAVITEEAAATVHRIIQVMGLVAQVTLGDCLA